MSERLVDTARGGLVGVLDLGQNNSNAAASKWSEMQHCGCFQRERMFVRIS